MWRGRQGWPLARCPTFSTGKRPISADTRRQVEECIRQTRLSSAQSAHIGAAAHRTGVLGLLAPLRAGARTWPRWTRLVSATMVAARPPGIMTCCCSHTTPVRRACVARRRPRSSTRLIVTDVQASDPRLPALMTLDRPVVADRRAGPADRAALCRRSTSARRADRAVGHLANLGHRSVGLVGLAAARLRAGNQLSASLHARFSRPRRTSSGSAARWHPCGDAGEGRAELPGRVVRRSTGHHGVGGGERGRVAQCA